MKITLNRNEEEMLWGDDTVRRREEETKIMAIF
jgi:hypothetical protein